MILSKRILRFLFAICLSAMLVTLLFFAKPIAHSVQNGVSICLNTLIPSLFVFMILADFTVKTGIMDSISCPFGWVCGKLFRSNTSNGTLLIMSVLCGYPVGAKLLASQVQQQQLSPQDASYMLAYCVNAGPAFLIGSVSMPLFGNAQYGLYIFLSHFTSFLLVGFCVGRIHPTNHQTTRPSLASGYAKCLVEAVDSSCKAMVRICAFVLFFAGLIGMIQATGLLSLILQPFPSETIRTTMKGILIGMLEISNGVVLCDGLPLPFFIAVFLTAFGGLCVHCQVRALAAAGGISLKYFYLFRPLYITASLGVSILLFRLDPPTIQTVVQNTKMIPQISASTPIGSFFLIFLSCFLLLCDKKSGTILDNKK